MRVHVISAVALTLLALPALAQDPAALLRQAREAKKAGQRDAASKLYAQAANRAAAVAGENSEPVADILDEHAELLFQAGRYAECVPVVERLNRIQTARHGQQSAEAAAALNRVALTYKLSGRVKDAVPLYESSLSTFLKVQPQNPGVALIIHNLAAAYAMTGRTDDAERLYVSGLKLIEKTTGAESAAFAQMLHNYATFIGDCGRHADAAEMFARVIELRKKALGEKAPQVAVSLNNLAAVKLMDGKAAEAEKLLGSALQIFKEAGYADHPHAVVSQNMLAEAHRDQGRLAEAAKLAGDTLARLEKAVGKDDPEVASCLVRVGQVAKDQVKYTDAETAYKRAIAIREAKLEPGHPRTIEAWIKLADVYRANERLEEAERLYRKAKVATDARFGKDHPKSADARRELALCLFKKGDYDAAESLLTEARKILTASKRADPFDLRKVDHATAEVYRETGRLADAEPLYDAAFKAVLAKHGHTHPLTASWAFDLGLLKMARRRYVEAEQMFAGCVAVREKTLGRSHPATLAAMETLAEVKQFRGRNEEAENLVRSILNRNAGADPMIVVRLGSNMAVRNVWAGDVKAATGYTRRALEAVKTVESKYAFDDPICWLARHNAGYVAAAAGDLPGAVREFDAARRSTRRFMAEALPGMAERDQIFVLDRFDRMNFHLALTLAADHPTDADVATRTAEWALNGKSLAQEALADVKRTGDRPVRATLNLRKQSAGLAIAPPAGDRKRPADPWVTLDVLRAALPDGAVFVDVVRLDPYRAAAGKQLEKAPAHYVAWVTAKTGTPRVIDLGPATKIDAAVASARKAITDAPAAIRADGEPAAEKKLREATADLTRLLLEPLRKATGGAKTWYVAPDGELWLYPWSALPVGDGYLAETVDVRYVSSGRDLLPGKGANAGGDCVIVADPDFDAGSGKMRQPGSKPGEARSPVAGLLGRVGRLPGTAVEANAVAPKLATLAARKPEVFTGEAATERKLKAVSRPRVLMLATHGFYLPPDPADKTAETDWFKTLTLPLVVGDEAVNPFRRSGLLLAGCNREPEAPDQDDGVLTGLDVLGLDLRGCELVVLSACETGLGEVRNGEGVGGLRQAFLAAGAGQVMSTLWQVPDLESARLMNRCFEFQSAGKPTATALRAAQLEAIARRRDRNAAAHPFFWAAYTLTGTARAGE